MITRAVAQGEADPEGRGRVRVEIPDEGVTAWAARVFPLTPYGDAEVPAGAAVWVGFERDDRAFPVVLGLVEPLARSAARTLQVERMGDAWDQGHAAGSLDGAQGSDTANPYR
ncbi:phage baseplate assembly protein V [Microbacterium sp. 1P10UB]|uniref:phage baseplate assembly protein V n=1 Tax=unclassified Microbacterium TaxID=2609290 RepID=UPI0039A2C284